MRKLLCLSCAAVVGVNVASVAQNTAFRSILPSNSDVKMVWQTMGYFFNGPSDGAGKNNKIQYMDSKNGTILDISGSIGSFKYEPSFTWDGTRVLFGTISGTFYVVTVPNPLTGEPRAIAGSYRGSCRAWRDAAGNDYLVATNGLSGSNKIEVVPIDPGKGTAKSISVPLLGKNATQTDADLVGFQWVNLTADGKYLAGGFPTVDALGFLTLSSTFTVAAQSATPGAGCWGTICRTYSGSPRMLHQYDVHVVERITSLSGSSTNLDMRKGVIGSNTMYSCTRWSNNEGYLTLCEGGGNDGNVLVGYKGPILVNISNSSASSFPNAVVFSSNSTEACEADAFIYSTTGAVAAPKSAGVAVLNDEVKSKMFDAAGRAARISKQGKIGISMTDQKKSVDVPISR